MHDLLFSELQPYFSQDDLQLMALPYTTGSAEPPRTVRMFGNSLRGYLVIAKCVISLRDLHHSKEE